jgi:hypothetical protein
VKNSKDSERKRPVGRPRKHARNLAVEAARGQYMKARADRAEAQEAAHAAGLIGITELDRQVEAMRTAITRIIRGSRLAPYLQEELIEDLGALKSVANGNHNRPIVAGKGRTSKVRAG